MKDKKSEENKREELKLVDDFKLNMQNENIEELNKNIEKLKNFIKEMIYLKTANDSQSNANPMSNLNDVVFELFLILLLINDNVSHS